MHAQRAAAVSFLSTVALFGVADAQDLGRITCPVMGMFVRNGLLNPDAAGFVTREQTLQAFLARGVPEHIARETTDANFKSTVCPACPERINPFEMNTIASGQLTGSPFNAPQEHFRSTGIRDRNAPFVGAFNLGERRCMPENGQWTEASMACFADVWDRDTGCPGVTSNDVDTNKRPQGCGRCESALQNPLCASQLGGAIANMFETFKDPVLNTIAQEHFRAMWLDLEFPPRGVHGDDFEAGELSGMWAPSSRFAPYEITAKAAAAGAFGLRLRRNQALRTQRMAVPVFGAASPGGALAVSYDARMRNFDAGEHLVVEARVDGANPWIVLHRQAQPAGFAFVRHVHTLTLPAGAATVEVRFRINADERREKVDIDNVGVVIFQE
eukprot:TRINITY_DN5050_c0_g3_i1.p1 TRINITY_DN5050_c0_g3~~TRINITY_DN5050_c0_g3_i1.p1  ORF type:complete len:385 (+),score=94.68 TRINITY_DN5050_c0_g3_i1:65-1219(+)